MNNTAPIHETATASTTVESVNSLPRNLKYAPPWSELTPRQAYWYWKLDRVISGILWVAKKRGLVTGYFCDDVKGHCFQAWPPSMDGKHFGIYEQWPQGSPSCRFIKVGRLVVIVDFEPEKWGKLGKRRHLVKE